MVYDSARNCLVLFGGDNYPAYYNDTWEFDGTDWKQIITEKRPSPRSYYSLAYDSSISLTILFSGYMAPNDTWAYDGVNWRQIITETSPERRVPVMVYNEAKKESFIFSGLNSDSRNIQDQWAFRYTSG